MHRFSFAFLFRLEGKLFIRTNFAINRNDLPVMHTFWNENDKIIIVGIICLETSFSLDFGLIMIYLMHQTKITIYW